MILFESVFPEDILLLYRSIIRLIEGTGMNIDTDHTYLITTTIQGEGLRALDSLANCWMQNVWIRLNKS